MNRQPQLFGPGKARMMSPYLVGINANLKKIDEILQDLHLVGKRSELKIKADELLRLTEMVRREAYLMSIDRMSR